jgi:hypothetical protein
MVNKLRSVRQCTERPYTPDEEPCCTLLIPMISWMPHRHVPLVNIDAEGEFPDLGMTSSQRQWGVKPAHTR